MAVMPPCHLQKNTFRSWLGRGLQDEEGSFTLRLLSSLTCHALIKACALLASPCHPRRRPARAPTVFARGGGKDVGLVGALGHQAVDGDLGRMGAWA